MLPTLFFVGLWWVLPDSANWLVTVTASVLLVGTAFLVYRTGPIWPSMGRRYFFSRHDAWMDALLILVPLIVGFALAGGPEMQLDSGQVVKSLIVYPIYALLQLSIFLAFPASRMRKMGQKSVWICLVCAAVFGLAHLPNMLLVAFTAPAMFVLCHQFLKGRSLLALALVMGIAATGFKLAVPPEWSWDMRIGWDYLEKREAFSRQGK